MKLKNPFILTGYFGPEYFCNRLNELNQLYDHYNNERNVVLYAWRRIGKTALIQRFINEIEEAGKAEVIYIDLLGTDNMEQAIEQLAKAVYNKFGSKSLGRNALQSLLSSLGATLTYDPVTGVPEINLSLNTPAHQKQSLNAIGTFLQKRKHRVLIAIDEFQQILYYDDKNVEAQFRSLAQNFPGIRFIFSGSHRSMMLSIFAEKNRPFYKSAQLMDLDPIALGDFNNFIKHHFKKDKKQISKETIAELYKWSRGQTYTIQLICNKLYGKFSKADAAGLKIIYQEILTQEAPVFANYQRLLSKAQWKLLEAIAKEEPLQNPLNNKFLKKHSLAATSTVNSALKSLMKKELVIREDDDYLIHDVLFARWLQSL